MAEPKLRLVSLEIVSTAPAPGHTVVIRPGRSSPPAVIKEGAEYSLRLRLSVSSSIPEVRFLHVVKRSGLVVDRIEQLLGPYAPSPDGEPYVEDLDPQEAPSGLLARSGNYYAHSRVRSDHEEYASFEWQFKIAEDWVA